MASSCIFIAGQSKCMAPTLYSNNSISSALFHVESSQIAFTGLPQRSSWSRNESRLRKSVESIRVLRKRLRPQVFEAALRSGVESSGDAATSNRDHEFLQVRLLSTNWNSKLCVSA